MRDSLNEPVSVVFFYDAKMQHIQPHSITWKERNYRLGKVDFWHRTREGTTLIHHFSMTDIEQTVYLKLALNTNTLHWVIEEYMFADDAVVSYSA
jgi:hypothetical protein